MGHRMGRHADQLTENQQPSTSSTDKSTLREKGFAALRREFYVARDAYETNHGLDVPVQQREVSSTSSQLQPPGSCCAEDAADLLYHKAFS